MKNSKELMLVYTFNPNNIVIPNCQRNLYIASILGIKNIRLYECFTDGDKEVDAFRSQKVCDKLVSTCRLLGYENIKVNGSIRGNGFSSQVVYYDKDSNLIVPSQWGNFQSFVEDNANFLENREGVGKKLVKRKMCSNSEVVL